MAKHFAEHPMAGPGRPKGSVSNRTVAINIIYEVFKEFGQHEFRKQMKGLVIKNPIAFYMKFIQPIQPKDITVSNPDGTNLTLRFDKTDERL